MGPVATASFGVDLGVEVARSLHKTQRACHSANGATA